MDFELYASTVLDEPSGAMATQAFTAPLPISSEMPHPSMPLFNKTQQSVTTRRHEPASWQRLFSLFSFCFVFISFFMFWAMVSIIIYVPLLLSIWTDFVPNENHSTKLKYFIF